MSNLVSNEMGDRLVVTSVVNLDSVMIKGFETSRYSYHNYQETSNGDVFRDTAWALK